MSATSQAPGAVKSTLLSSSGPINETEQGEHGSVQNALNANDPRWRERELIIFPSHVHNAGSEIDEMIDAAHSGGFDAVCASLIMTGDNGDDRLRYSDLWRRNWDQRWTLPNPHATNWTEQVEALGRDLWTWITRGITS